jgi:hypothetical protein
MTGRRTRRLPADCPQPVVGPIESGQPSCARPWARQLSHDLTEIKPMRIEEAVWIEGALARHLPALREREPARAVLNLGSGPRRAREVNKPHVHARTIRPLVDAGYRVVHSDLVAADGVDIAGDLFDPALQARLRELDAVLVMFCNVLEHLPARLLPALPAALDAVVPPGGLLLVAAPNSYPYHPDPIDNLARPSLEELAAMFPGWGVVDRALLEAEGYGPEFRRGSAWKRARKLLRLLFPFVRPRRWLSHAHRMLWLGRPYRHALVLLRKPPNDTAGR